MSASGVAVLLQVLGSGLELVGLGITVLEVLRHRQHVETHRPALGPSAHLTARATITASGTVTRGDETLQELQAKDRERRRALVDQAVQAARDAASDDVEALRRDTQQGLGAVHALVDEAPARWPWAGPTVLAVGIVVQAVSSVIGDLA